MLCSPLVWGFCLLPTLDSLSPLSRERVAGMAGMAGMAGITWLAFSEPWACRALWGGSAGVGQGEFGLCDLADPCVVFGRRKDPVVSQISPTSKGRTWLLVPSGLAGRVSVVDGGSFWRDSVCLVLTGPEIPHRTGRNSHRLGGRGHHPWIWKPVCHILSWEGHHTLLPALNVTHGEKDPPAGPRAAACAFLSPLMGQGRCG